MAEMPAIWERLLEQRIFLDLTWNGLSRPNGFGRQLYAQALLCPLILRH